MEIFNASMNVAKEYCTSINEDAVFSFIVEVGKIKNIEISKHKNRETGQEFELIDLIIEDAKGKNKRKSWSVDFVRKYLRQLGVKLADTFGAVVLFTLDPQYKSPKFLCFNTVVDGVPVPSPYVDEEKQDYIKRIEELGL